MDCALQDRTKDLVSNFVDASIGNVTRGIIRHDSVFVAYPNLSVQSLPQFIDQHQLHHFHRIPDITHIVENISNSLYPFISQSISNEAFSTVEKLLAEHSAIKQLRSHNPSYRWRLIWTSYPIVWAKSIPPTPGLFHDILFMIYCFAVCIMILYSKPQYRCVKNWLRLCGYSFMLLKLMIKYKLKIKLSEHLLFPHVVGAYWYCIFLICDTSMLCVTCLHDIACTYVLYTLTLYMYLFI